MIEIQKKGSGEAAITVPPPLRQLQKEVSASVGTLVKITPDVATEWLETRGDNRKVMQGVVDGYATEMREGRWIFNGAPIQFDEEGKLLNGQHRLWAIIESGCTIEAVVQWGIPRSAQATIDTGARWQGKDVLYMKGEKNVHLLQAALKWVYKDEIGAILGMKSISNSKVMEILGRHPNLRRSVEYVKLHKGPLVSSIAAFLHYKVAAEDPERADIFFARLADGLELSENNPIYRLREKLANNWKSMTKISHVDSLAIAIIAWNYFRAGRNTGQLAWRKTGPNAQPFPTIEGAEVMSHKVQKAKPRKLSGAPMPETGERREVTTGAVARHKRS